ncbi:Uncharacterised protein [Serratia fonticola]|uniref:Uncharacterized protein n=1 Tax=Serratia fonticola TaxID=47917 RepID=A0A4U9TNA4_SERFO|nr:Uncharacterised protein [Serratia fonticola]
MLIEKVLRSLFQIGQIQFLAVRPGDQRIDDAVALALRNGLQQQQKLVTPPFRQLANHAKIDKPYVVVAQGHYVTGMRIGVIKPMFQHQWS